MNKTTSVIIIDDHRIVRKGLKELIENLGNYKVIDEYENGIAFLGQLPHLKTIPDLFILDYSMPIKNGIEVLKEATTNFPDYKFLLLTQNLEENIINEAYKNGARGFLNKTCTAQELKSTIDTITTIGYNNISEILKRIRTSSETKNIDKQLIQFSEKEYTFLELVCNEKEYTYSKMADIMNVSVKTIDKYRANLFIKLNVKSKTGLVLYSHKHQLTKPFKKE